MYRRNFLSGCFSALAAIPAAALGCKAEEPDDGAPVVKNCTIRGELYLPRWHGARVENVKFELSQGDYRHP